MEKLNATLYKVEKSPLLLCLVLLILFILSSQLGVFIVWGAVTGIIILWRQTITHKKRIHVLNIIQERYTRKEEIPTAECKWVNLLIEKYWITCHDQVKDSIHSEVLSILNKFKPTQLGTAKFREKGFSLGDRPPIIEKIDANSFLLDHEMQLDVNFYFRPDRDFTLDVSIIPSIPSVPVKLSHFVLLGKARIFLTLNSIHPKLSEFSFSLLKDPIMDFELSPIHSVDLMGIPVIYDWAQDSITNSISSILWPHKIVCKLPNHASFLPLIELVNPEIENRPITDIGFAQVNDILPEGWEIIQKSVTGEFPADVNRGSPFPELYLCIKRSSLSSEVNEDPITGLCLVFPNRPEKIPDGFHQISTTFTGDEASLNPGVKKDCYLCYSKNKNWKPITNIGIFNKTMERNCPEKWTMIELSPEGHRANLNKGKPEADEIYLIYSGGNSNSYFGFPREISNDNGLLKVTLTSAINLHTPDIGGSCDTYVDMFVSYGAAERTVSKICRVPIAEKTTNPKWEQVAIFKATQNDFLNIFFYNVNNLKDDLCGVLKFPLDTLVVGKQIRGWYPLQMAPQGHGLVTLEALNFGLLSGNESEIPQIDVGKSGRKLRKFKTTERPTRPTLTEMSSQVVSSLRYNGQKKILSFLDELVSEKSEKPEKIESIPTTHQEAASILENSVSDMIIEKKGFLEKLVTGTSNTKKVKQAKRWFVLRDGLLSCYKSPKEKNAQESLNLKDGKVIKEELHLIVRNTKTRWDLYASTLTEAESWYLTLKKHITYLIPSDSSIPANN